jgi:dTDP-4-amino-4,6-dideoxygalactose transaminase
VIDFEKRGKFMVRFNVPPFYRGEEKFIHMAIKNHKISGDGQFTKKCNEWLENRTQVARALLTTSCTHALEEAAILANIKNGDEVILPSFTFCSTANAFVQRGASLVFVDIRPDTMNINERLIEEAITTKTRAIIPVHYAGVSCEMDYIMGIAKQYNLLVIEDAAQGVMSMYKNKQLGTIGEFGCYSFHETKNYSMGEGGAILIRDTNMIEKAEIIREKGTNRSKYFRGQIDKYTWMDYGSSYLPSELNAAYLWAQLEAADKINSNRLNTWGHYKTELKELEAREYIQLQSIPNDCIHNAHMFYCKLKNLSERTAFIEFLKERNVQAVFHYVPLHSAPAGMCFGRFHGRDVFTTSESERLVRLPLYYNMTANDQSRVIDGIKKYFIKK